MFKHSTLGERDCFSWSCMSIVISHAHVAVLLPVTLTRSFPNASFSPVSKCYLSVGVADRGSSVAFLITAGETKPGKRSNLSWRQREGGIHTEPAPPST